MKVYRHCNGVVIQNANSSLELSVADAQKLYDALKPVLEEAIAKRIEILKAELAMLEGKDGQ